MRRILGYSVALVPVSLAPAFMGRVGLAYLAGASVLGLGLVYAGIRLAAVRSNSLARGMVLASITYLPALLVLLMVDKVG